MPTVKVPSQYDLMRAIERGAISGLNEAMAKVAGRAAEISPYDVAERDREHMRNNGRVIPARAVNHEIVGGVSWHARNPKTGFDYAPIQHQGYWVDDRGRHPKRHYFKYTYEPAKRQFLWHAIRSNRLAVRRTVARDIRASLSLAGVWR